jgi:hypothetical protein
MMEFSYPILDTVLRIVMLEAVGLNYPGAGVGPCPFDIYHPRPMDHPFAQMVSAPLAPLSEEEWEWMVVPTMGTWEALALASSPPPVAVLMAPASVAPPAPVAHTVEVDGGLWRCRRSPTRCGWSPPCLSSPRRGR